MRKLALLITVGALIAFLVKKLRGDPAPQFANHPTVRGGPLPDLVPAPADPTVAADAGTRLVEAPTDPTVAADAGSDRVAAPQDPTVPATDPEPATTSTEAAPAPEPDLVPEPAATGTEHPELDLPPLEAAPEDPTVPASAEPALIADDDAPIPPAPATQAEASGEQAWVEPLDGECPDGYPIKAKVKSGIYHQPGGLAYERTNPDRCYPDAASAEADGLRAAKR